MVRAGPPPSPPTPPVASRVEVSTLAYRRLALSRRSSCTYSMDLFVLSHTIGIFPFLTVLLFSLPPLSD